MLLVIAAVAVFILKAGETNRTLALVLGALVLVGLIVWRDH
jgi:hypothetical protein